MNTEEAFVEAPIQEKNHYQILIDLENTLYMSKGTKEGSIFTALPASREGVSSLMHLGYVTYCTNYHSPNPYARQCRQLCTTQWLRDLGFPNSEQVLFCAKLHYKLAIIYEVFTSQGVPVTLIDDQVYTLLLGLGKQVQNQPEMLSSFRQYLTLVVFGAERPPTLNFGIRTLALPAWEQYASLLPHFIQSKEHHIPAMTFPQKEE